MRYRHETASFRGNDAVCLVEASLACRVCLSSEVEWSLSAEPWDSRVTCRCMRCGDQRDVSLTDDQAMRLSLDPQLA